MNRRECCVRRWWTIMLRENTTTFDLMGSIKAYSWFSLLVYGAVRHFQQYFSNFVAVSYIGGRNRCTCRILWILNTYTYYIDVHALVVKICERYPTEMFLETRNENPLSQKYPHVSHHHDNRIHAMYIKKMFFIRYVNPSCLITLFEAR